MDADYYVCQWAEYNSLKQRKVIRQAKEVRKYTGINFDEISAEYESYDFWCTCAENSQKWVDNVNKTDEKYLEIIDKVIDSIPTANAFIIEFTPTNADEEVLTSYNQVIKGVCHGIYSKTDIVTKAPAAALTVPKSVIENDYIYRKNFKEKYGIELPKYITILSYFWDSMTDDLFMQLDDIDTNLLSNTNGNRWEYIGELLSDVIFDAGSTELSSEISRQRKSKTPDNAKIEKIESKLDDMFSKREFEKGDGTFSVSLSKTSAEAYSGLRKKFGSSLDEMLSKLGEHADEIIEYADNNEDDFEYITKNHIPIFLETFTTNPQYYDDIKKLIEKFSGDHKQEPFKDEPNAYDLRVAQYELAKVYEKLIVYKDYSNSGLSPSKILRDEMYNAGIYCQQYENAAHHIVAYDADEAQPARDILDKYGIELNSASNGVFLPTEYHAEFGNVAYHNGGHTNDYYNYVNDQLLKVQDEIDEKNLYIEGDDESRRYCAGLVCKKIQEIRIELLTGKLKINNYGSE